MLWCVMLWMAPSARAACFTVSNSYDDPNITANRFCAPDSDGCTLPEAIYAANDNPGPDLIFIGNDISSINVQTDLPPITTEVTLATFNCRQTALRAAVAAATKAGGDTISFAPGLSVTRPMRAARAVFSCDNPRSRLN